MQYKSKSNSNKSQFVSSETSNSISSSRTTSTATIAANSAFNGQDHQSSNNDFFILFNDLKQENVNHVLTTGDVWWVYLNGSYFSDMEIIKASFIVKKTCN